jgi:hypothetical protein
LIWSLERATSGQVLYLESPSSGARLDWRLARDYILDKDAADGWVGGRPLAVTSQLITLPPPGAVAHLKVAFLREPMARIASAYHHKTTVQESLQPISFAEFIELMLRSTLANYQTRHLSPQEPADWRLSQGWAARPELIDLGREDLFVGIVERYDESIVALEHQLEQLGMPMDLAYPEPHYTTRPNNRDGSGESPGHNPPIQFVTELDSSLYRRAEQRLEERLSAVPDLDRRLGEFQRRRQALAANPSRDPIRVKPQSKCVHLPIEA